MSTRSLTRFKENGKAFCCMYRQMDGYPEGHGVELAEFLGKGKLVNGIGGVPGENLNFNGMGCLAAQVVAHFKGGIGGFYIYHPDTLGAGEEYIYTIEPMGEDIFLTVEEVGCESIVFGMKPNRVLYRGTPVEVLAIIKKESGQ